MMNPNSFRTPLPVRHPTRSSLSFVAVLMLYGLCSGCADRGRVSGPEWAQQTDVSTNTLAGIWVIEQQSLDSLRRAGYQKYMKRTDHVILLNPDGSCVARTYGYRYPFVSSVAEEDGLYLTFWDVDEWKTWYTWDPQAMNPLNGPFATCPTNTGRAVFVNHFQRWRIYDQEAERKIEGSRLPRFWVWLYNVSGDPPGHNLNYWSIGKKANNLVLFNDTRYLGVLEFEKMSLARFVSLCRSECQVEVVGSAGH